MAPPAEASAEIVDFQESPRQNHIPGKQYLFPEISIFPKAVFDTISCFDKFFILHDK